MKNYKIIPLLFITWLILLSGFKQNRNTKVFTIGKWSGVVSFLEKRISPTTTVNDAWMQLLQMIPVLLSRHIHSELNLVQAIAWRKQNSTGSWHWWRKKIIFHFCTRGRLGDFKESEYFVWVPFRPIIYLRTARNSLLHIPGIWRKLNKFNQ